MENTNKKKNFIGNIKKLPKIIPRISLTNFHKNKEINNEFNQNVVTENTLGLFNKTSGTLNFRGITFNNGIKSFKKLNTDPNKNINFISCKDEMLRYNFIKKSLNDNDNKIIKNIQINNININKINTKNEKKKIYLNKNLFNKKITVDNSNKYYNKMSNAFNHDIANDNLFSLNKNTNKIEDENKNVEKKMFEEKENVENNLCMEDNISMRENNDSFINELNDILSNVKGNDEQNEENYKNDLNDSDEDDKEPDPRINFEQISRVNKSRPQTSYGGLNQRRKNLQSALNNRKEKNRPVTSNLQE